MQPSIHSANQSSQDKSSSVEELVKSAKNASIGCPRETLHTYFPTWVNPEAIQAGKEFISRHFFLIFFTHFISLILLLSYIPVKVVLLKTRRSHTKELALARYVSTLSHVKLWYEGNLSSPNDSATRDVIKVRQIHCGLEQKLQGSPSTDSFKLPDGSTATENCFLSALKKCVQSRDENNNMPNNSPEKYTPIISQLDMIVTQYCFMGLLATFPRKFGIDISSRKEAEGLNGFIHMWAVIGRLLGIRDDFNLCIGNKSTLKEYILNKILIENFARTDVQTFTLWKALVAAVSDFVPFISLHAALVFILKHTLGLKNGSFPEVYKQGTLYDAFCFRLTLFIFFRCFRISYIKNVFNKLLRFAIYVTSLRLSVQKKVRQFKFSL